MLSDLCGQKRLEYSSFNNFREQLVEWMKQALAIPSKNFKGITFSPISFTEDFKDRDKFLRLWNIPPGCQYILTYEGLQFVNADFPILTQTLNLMGNFEFTFKAKIIHERVGWVIKGTLVPQHILPSFCIMFNVSTDGELRAHILNSQKNEKPIYNECERKKIRINLANRCFEVKTQFRNDNVIVKVDEKEVLRRNLKTDTRYSNLYDFSSKGSQVGFRCARWDEAGEWGETAVVGHVKVIEIK
jgi:hypothetical protein